MSFEKQHPRYELKFKYPLWKKEALKSALIFQREPFKKAYASRQINNIYFDSFDMKSINDNLSGSTPRYKLRLRWYGDTHTITNPRLEIKYKNGMLINKDILQFSDFSRPLNISKKELLKSIKKAIPTRHHYLFNRFSQMVLFNRYLRDYYVTKDNLIRLTIDNNLESLNILPYSKISFKKDYNPYPFVIVELKFMETELKRISPIVSNWKSPLGNFSKMVNGFYNF